MGILNKIVETFSTKESASQKWYKKRREIGKCLYCSKDSGEFYACESCRKKRNKYFKRYKKTWRK